MKKTGFLMIVLILLVPIVMAINIDYNNPQIESQEEGNLSINISLATDSLSELIYNWNSNNYTIYNNSLILMYNFDNITTLGESETNVIDASNNSKTGNMIGNAAHTDGGRYGKAMTFDGSGDYINITNSIGTHIENITASAWIKTTSSGASNNPWAADGIISKYNIDGALYGWRLVYLNNNKASFTYISIGCVTDYATGTSTLNDNQWHHILGTRDNSSIKLYVDGTLEGEDTSIECAPESNNVSIKIGAKRDGDGGLASEDFAGQIDEVRIWNRTLSAGEAYIEYRSNLNKYDTDKWTFYANMTNLTPGQYTYQAFATDHSGTANQTTLRTITIGQSEGQDSTPPQITFTSPTPDNAATTTNTSIQINATITESNIKTITYNWDGTNYTIFDDSLILMYNFDNLSALGENNSKVVDLSKYGHNGTLYNGTLLSASGIYNGAIDFNLTGDKIIVGDIDGMDGTQYLTISAWVRYDTVGAYDYFITKGNTLLSSINYSIAIGPSSSQDAFIRISNGDNSYAYSNFDFLTSGTWIHWTIVYNGTAPTNQTRLKFYYNGMEKELTYVNNVPETTPSNEYDVALSGWSNTDSNVMDGLVDELRIWNRSLSAEEVYQQYTSNLRKFNSAQWHLYINQSKNATTGLTPGTYTYQAFATDTEGSQNQTEQRTITLETEQEPQSETPFNSDSTSSSEWSMYGRYLNHTSWDGIDYPVIEGLENTYFTTGAGIASSVPVIANGYVYVGSADHKVYQLNASNVSQQIASFTTGSIIYSSPIVVDGYVYIGSNDNILYQLNASDISQKIANYTTNSDILSTPSIANGYIYIGTYDDNFYQLNASNISQKIANHTIKTISSAAIANDYVYIGDEYNLYQLNASNVSQEIAIYNTTDEVDSSPAVANGYVYVGGFNGNLYQFDILPRPKGRGFPCWFSLLVLA